MHAPTRTHQPHGTGPRASYRVCPLSGKGEQRGLMKFCDAREGRCQAALGWACRMVPWPLLQPGISSLWIPRMPTWGALLNPESSFCG